MNEELTNDEVEIDLVDLGKSWFCGMTHSLLFCHKSHIANQLWSWTYNTHCSS